MTKQIFISHAWGKDDLDRDNHKRCRELCDTLILKGYTVWIDQYDMYGNIDSAIMKGINNCNVVIICLTEKYCNKINNAVNHQTPNDNCYKEWNYSLFKQKILLPVMMENKMRDAFFQEGGVIQMYLNATMFMDFTDSLDNDIDLLYKTLKKFNIYTKSEQKFYNIKPNSSFDNLTALFNTAIKTISPRLRGSDSPSPKSPSPKSPSPKNQCPKSPSPESPFRETLRLENTILDNTINHLRPIKSNNKTKPSQLRKEYCIDSEKNIDNPAILLRKTTRKSYREYTDKLTRNSTKKILKEKMQDKYKLLVTARRMFNNKKTKLRELIRI